MENEAVGIALITAGMGLRAWALHTLRHAAGLTWNSILSISRPPHYTTLGPYRWLRHPAYLGSMLAIAGVGALTLGWAGIILVLPAWPFFAKRMYEEDRLR